MQLNLRRPFRFSGPFLGFIVAVSLVGGAMAVAAERPNVIVIVADDLGFGDLGVNGCRDIPTPHIDALAARGIRCTNGYVSGPYCSPTRAGLMTGRYQERFGHEFNPGPAVAENIQKGLSTKEQTLPARMKSLGYVTGMVGKWHLGHSDDRVPTARGFDEFFGFLGGAHSYFKSGFNTAEPILRGREPIDEQEYLTDAFAREAVAFVERHKSEPFFLYYAFNAVHSPMEATEKYLSRFPNITDAKRKAYAGMLSAMDDAIGAVMTKLQAEGLDQRTLVFFISDNGGPENSNGSDNGPFRGQKAQTWEGGVHVPFFVSWPAKLPAGKTYDQPVIQLDILPTTLAAAGGAVSSSDRLDGVNLLPYLTGENKGVPHEALYWRFGQQIAIRMGDWKLVKARGDGEPTERVGMATTDGAHLYNLATDIGEEHDLAQTETARFNSLKAAWDKWNAELVAPEWGPPRNARRAPRNRATQRNQQNSN